MEKGSRESCIQDSKTRDNEKAAIEKTLTFLLSTIWIE